MILIIVKYQKLLTAQVSFKRCFLSYQELVCQNIFEEGDNAGCT